jgi:hypothetical protein
MDKRSCELRMLRTLSAAAPRYSQSGTFRNASIDLASCYEGYYESRIL